MDTEVREGTSDSWNNPRTICQLKRVLKKPYSLTFIRDPERNALEAVIDTGASRLATNRGPVNLAVWPRPGDVQWPWPGHNSD